MSLKDVSVGIRTFLRDDKLFRAIDGIRTMMPEVHMIIADDGRPTQNKDRLYSELSSEGHDVIFCDFDSGFGYKSNAIAKSVLRPYLLIGSDDFDFSDPQALAGIEKMTDVLDRYPYYSAVSGRVNNQRNEFWLSDHGWLVVERQADESPRGFGTNEVFSVDLTVNYTMLHRSVFQDVSWDDDQKIGNGEHGAFFVDMLRAEHHVGFIPGVNINEQPGKDSDEYYSYRYRARSPERSCFVKRGIKKYVLADGAVDYEEK